MGGQQQTPASTVPKREKKILQFVNPDTGMAVNLSNDQESSTASTDMDTAAAAAAASEVGLLGRNISIF